MKLLITGGSGFLGSRIAEYYKDRYEILTPSHTELDVTNKESVAAFFINERPELVIHCAAVSDVLTCEKDPENSAITNVVGTLNVAQLSAQYGAKIIICSSDQVYCGNRGNRPHNEDEVVFPYNQYGKQKRSAEKESLRVNPQAKILRLTWMYDTRNMDDLRRMDYPRILADRLKRNETIKYSSRDRRGITDVWDVIKNLEKAFDLPGGIYNFGSHNDCDTFNLTKNVLASLGVSIRFVEEDINAFANNSRNLVMSQDKINRYGIAFGSTLNGLIENMQGKIELPC